MNPRSIRFRLTTWYTAILACTMAVMGVGVWLALNQPSSHYTSFRSSAAF